MDGVSKKGTLEDEHPTTGDVKCMTYGKIGEQNKAQKHDMWQGKRLKEKCPTMEEAQIMICGKERGQRRNSLFRKVPCGTRSICMVKRYHLTRSAPLQG
jgi:hypothetical protein